MWQKSNTSAALMRSVKRTDIQNPLTRARSDVHIGAASVALSDFADRCRVLVACTTQRCLEPTSQEVDVCRHVKCLVGPHVLGTRVSRRMFRARHSVRCHYLMHYHIVDICMNTCHACEI